MEGGDPLSGLGSNKRCMSLNNLVQNTNVSTAFLLLLSSIIMIFVNIIFRESCSLTFIDLSNLNISVI